MFWNWTVALLLLLAIGLHEAGHWLTLRLLGYRNLQIMMLPLVGGVTLGEETHHNTVHRILVSLMGPLPGILLGTLILGFNGMQGGWLAELGIILLLVNYLNLLPIMPLDGGQLLKTLIPFRRFKLLIAIEWLGAVFLLLLGGLTGSLLIAAMALLPLFGGLTLMKRKRVLDALKGITEGAQQPESSHQVASIIKAIDETDKRYRPLMKKTREIAEILTTFKLKPAAPTVAQLFLAIYLATLLLLPITIFATSPGILSATTLLFSDIEVLQQEALKKAMALPMPQLVTGLTEMHRNIHHPDRSKGDIEMLRPPATNEIIHQAETRLGTRLDTTHRQFLEISNGFVSPWSPPNETEYLLFPVEQVGRFGQQLPVIVNRLLADSGKETPPPVSILDASATLDSEAEALNLNQIAHMLFIGNLHSSEYLLLDPTQQPNTPGSLLVVHESPAGLEGVRFESLRHYLADYLSAAQFLQLDRKASE
jgi:Zn-dependent protease